MLLLPGGEEQFGVHFWRWILRIEQEFLREEREAHELDANNVPAASNARERELTLGAGYRGIFLAGQGVGGSDGRTRQRSLTAARRTGNFIGRGRGARRSEGSGVR